MTPTTFLYQLAESTQEGIDFLGGAARRDFVTALGGRGGSKVATFGGSGGSKVATFGGSGGAESGHFRGGGGVESGHFRGVGGAESGHFRGVGGGQIWVSGRGALRGGPGSSPDRGSGAGDLGAESCRKLGGETRFAA